MSKRKHSRISNSIFDQKSTISSETTISSSSPSLLANFIKQEDDLTEKTNPQQIVANCCVRNVKTEPEQLNECDSFEQNSDVDVHSKKRKILENLDGVQQNMCSTVGSTSSNVMNSVQVKTEPIEDEISPASHKNDPLVKNIKTELGTSDFTNLSQSFPTFPDDEEATVAASGKKKTTALFSEKNSSSYNIVANIVNSLHAPMSIIDGAFKLFQRVVSSGLLRSRPRAIIASSCVYIVCRQDGVPRTFQEIAAVSKVSKKELGRSFRLIVKGLDTSLSTIKTDDFMCRFCHSLGLGDEVTEAAECIAKKAAQLDLVPGRSPVSVSAAAIYMAAQATGCARSALEISKATGVCETTVLVVYRSIYPYARELFPPNFVFRKSIEDLTTARLIF